MAIGDTRIAITVINTDDFIEIYNAIDSTKRKIPARILRYCKEQMYELVKSSSPEAKLVVTDIDQIENKDDVEFVMGVGVAQNESMSKMGYKGVSITDIFSDVIEDKGSYDSATLLRETYPELTRRPNRYIPIYKHLRDFGITSRKELLASEFSDLVCLIDKATREDLKTSAYESTFNRDFSGLSLQEIIGSATSEKAAIVIPFLDDSQIDPQVLRDFLKQHESMTRPGTNYGTYFRKLACLLDRIENGF